MPGVAQSLGYLALTALGIAVGVAGLGLAALVSAAIGPLVVLYMAPDFCNGVRAAYAAWLESIGSVADEKVALPRDDDKGRTIRPSDSQDPP